MREASRPPRSEFRDMRAISDIACQGPIVDRGHMECRNLNDLVALLAVVRERIFTKAVAKLGITVDAQPHISKAGYSDAAQAAPPDLRILHKPFDAEALRGFIQEMTETSLTD